MFFSALRHIPTLFCLLLVFTGDVWADHLILVNGDRLTGTVMKKENNSLEFETSYAGRIKVHWDQVSSVVTEEPLTILLSDGEVLQGNILKNEGGMTTIGTEDALYPRTLDMARVAFINPAPWRMGQGFRSTGLLNMSLVSDRGNTDSDELDFDGEITLRRKNDRFKSFGQYERDATNGQRTAESWSTTGKYDYFATKKLYYSGNIFLEQDEFADLNLRASAGPAVGYQFFESTAINLAVEGGINRVHEDYLTQDDNNYWAGRWFVDFDYYLFDKFLQFFHRHQGILSLEDTEDIVIKSRTGFRLPLFNGITATAEAEVEWDNGAAPDADKVDTTYRYKLGYAW